MAHRWAALAALAASTSTSLAHAAPPPQGPPAVDAPAIEAHPAAGPEAHGFGLGAAATLVGVAGVEAVVTRDRLLFSLLFNASHDDPDAGQATTRLSLSGGAFYAPWRWSAARLAVGGRLDVRWARAGGPTATSFHQIDLEVPLRGEVYLAPRFSLHLEAGVAIEMVDEADLAAPGGFGRPPGTYLSIGEANLLGNAGFTVYLD